MDSIRGVNFFRPANEMSRANNRLITRLIILWAVAVFGFHMTLIVLSKPTPEKAFTDFQAAWNNSQPTKQEQIVIIKAVITVLGKNIVVKNEHKEVLKKALAAFLFKLQKDEPALNTNFLEPLNLAYNGFDKIYRQLAEFYLPLDNANKMKTIAISFNDADQTALPRIMSFYLTHNQSILTDLSFLGFPFHYWYTAQFLLILFIGICFFYAKSTDKLHKKFDFLENDE